MESKLIEEIIEFGLKNLEELPNGTKTTTNSLIIEKLKSIEIKLDFDDMFKIDKEIKKRAIEKGIILDFSEYKDKDVGLPYNIPFTKIEKNSL